MIHPLASSLNENPSNGRPLSGNTDVTDLNVILRQIFELYEPEFQKVAAVVRCDTLPSVRCQPEELMHVFEDLLFMIMQNPPDTGRLLIYIKCEPLTDTVKKHVSTGTDQFKISIHTNISKGADWEGMYASRLFRCKTTCEAGGGVFTFHNNWNSGCNFTLLLPGKLI